VAGLPTGLFVSALVHAKAVFTSRDRDIFQLERSSLWLSTGFLDMLAYRAATGIGEAMQFTVLPCDRGKLFLPAGVQQRSVCINFCYALGAIVSPVLGGFALNMYHSWPRPDVFCSDVSVYWRLLWSRLTVKPWFTETQSDSNERTAIGGAATVFNRNTVLSDDYEH